ncbi:ABC transporter permease [Listeria riparia]|uniref:ABC transporter permease n=1 Tax=Listeria riparia TaxID=1494964 RepID=UPI001F4C7D6C|nr:ABC transporter permease [Listeria riparia]
MDNAKLELLALPKIITSSSNYENSFPVSNTKLVKGRLPEDNKNEIALSFAQLEKFFNYDSKAEASIIGERVVINGAPFKIVGIVNSPVAAISYSNQMQQYGATEVSDKNTAQLNDMLSNLQKQGYEDPHFVSIFIETTTKKTSGITKLFRSTWSKLSICIQLCEPGYSIILIQREIATNTFDISHSIHRHSGFDSDLWTKIF